MDEPYVLLMKHVGTCLDPHAHEFVTPIFSRQVPFLSKPLAATAVTCGLRAGSKRAPTSAATIRTQPVFLGGGCAYVFGLRAAGLARGVVAVNLRDAVAGRSR